MTELVASQADTRIDTKARIMDVAERLFAHQGFSETSLRQITAEAKVNLAAVNYHFQSKDSLIQAVLLRKIGPVNRRRLELLDEAESREAPLHLESVYRAFFQPLFEAEQNGVDLASFPRLLARIYSDEYDLMPTFRSTFGEVVERFGKAFGKALPGMEMQVAAMAIHFSIGSLAHLLGANRILAMMTQGSSDELTRTEMLDNLIHFCSGGARALHAGRRLK